MNTTTIANATEYRNLPLAVLTESQNQPAPHLRGRFLEGIGRFCARTQNRPFVPQTVLWPNVTNGAWQRAVRVPSDT